MFRVLAADVKLENHAHVVKTVNAVTARLFVVDAPILANASVPTAKREKRVRVKHNLPLIVAVEIANAATASLENHVRAQTIANAATVRNP